MVFIRAEGYVSQQSPTPEKPKGEFFPWVETSQRSPGSGCEEAGSINFQVVQHFSRSVTIFFLCFTTNSVLVLFLVLCEVSIHVFVHVCVQAKNSNGTTVRTFSNFNLLRGRCTLLPVPSALMSLCAPELYNWLAFHFNCPCTCTCHRVWPCLLKELLVVVPKLMSMYMFRAI